MKKIVAFIAAAEHGKDTAAERLLASPDWIRLAFGDALYLEVSQAFKVSVEKLRDRKTKETDVSWMALKNCNDMLFVKVVGLCTGVSSKVVSAAVHFLSTGKTTKDVPQRAVKAFINKKRSPRFILQLWGTEYKRKFMDRDSYWLDIVMDAVSATSKNVVITDCRFPNEADAVESKGGVLVRIVRPALVERDKNAQRAQHISEKALADRPVHRTLVNVEGNLNKLWESVDSLFD